MAATEKVLALLLKLQTDPATQRKTERDLEALRELLDKTSKATISIDEAGAKVNARLAELARAKAVDKIAEDAIQAARDANGWADALERVAQNLSDIGASDGEIQRVTDAIARAEQQSSVTSFGGGGFDRATSSGAQILSGLGQGEAANAVGLVGDLVQGFTTLNPVMLGLTGITVGVTAVVAALNAEQEANRQRVEETAAALQKEKDARQALLGVIGSTNPNDINVRAADLRAQINGITQEQLNPLLNQRNEMITAAFQAQAGLPQFANVDEQRRQQMAVAAVDSSSTGQALKAQIEAVRGALSPLNDQLRDLETVGAQGARILQDINAPLSELQQMQGLQNLTTADLRKRQLDAMQTVTAYGQAVARADQQIRDARASGNSVLVDALTIEKARLDAAFDAAQAELDLLNTRGEAIAAINDAAAAEKARSEALKQQTQNYFDALEKEGAAREKLAEAGQALQEVNAKAAEQTAKNAAEAEEKRNDIVAEGGDQRAELERKTQEAIRKVERDYARTKFRAIGERDALEARMAQIAREDQLDDQRRADDEAATKLEEAQTKQLRTLEKSLQKQAEAQNTALVREQATKMMSYQRAQLDLMNAENNSAAIQAQEIAGRLIKEEAANEEKLSQQKLFNERMVKTTKDGLTQRLNDLTAATRSETQIKRTGQMQALNDLASTETVKTNLHRTAQNQELLRVSTGYAQMYSAVDQYMTAIANRFVSGLQQMANALPTNSIRGYNSLYGVMPPPVTQQTVTRTVDYRLNQYFQSAGITER